MIRKKIKITVSFLIFAVILSSSIAFSWSFDNKEEDANNDTYNGAEKINGLVAGSQNLEFYFSETNSSITIKDKRNDFLWSTPVNVSGYDCGNNDFIKSNITAPFSLKCVDPKSKITNEIFTYANENSSITAKKIINGVSVNYDLKNVKIKLSLEFTLENDQLAVYMPISQINEYGALRIVSLELLPFFGGAKDTEDGYVFYPDGSGAISNFKKNHPTYFKNYSQSVFGTDIINLNENKFSNNKSAMLPVFGIKKGNNAFYATIKDGEFDSYINFYPSGYQININRISPMFVIRRMYNASIETGALVQRIYDKMVKSDHRVIYKFLQGENANYSGMANDYRENLIKEGKIKSTINQTNKTSLGLDLFMGIEEQQILKNKYIPMTTFLQAEQILNELKNKGIEQIDANLIGWTKNGYGNYYNKFPANSALGGQKGFADLIKKAKELNINLTIQDNLINIDTSTQKIDKKHTVFEANRIVAVTDYTQKKYLLSPSFILNKMFLTSIDEYKKLGIKGINFEKFGEWTYFDFNKNYKDITREETAGIWQKILKQTKDEIGYVAVTGGNEYVLSSVDRLYDIPYEDSKYFFTDAAIPFYQMVVHGLVPYTTTAINMFYDPKKQFLKMVEYGYMPRFILTFSDSQEMLNTNYNQLFSSKYSNYIDTVTSIYSRLNQDISMTNNKKMINHIPLASNLYRVDYEGGIRVYINYSNSEQTYEGVTIKAMDYTVKGGNNYEFS